MSQPFAVSHRSRAFPCPFCNKNLDVSAGWDEAEPQAGDISICMYCRNISIFTGGKGSREPTFEEAKKLAGDQRITTTMKVLKELMEDEDGQEI